VVAGMKAMVVYSYDADQDDELSLAVGDVILVIAQVLLLVYLSMYEDFYLRQLQLIIYAIQTLVYLVVL